MNRFKQAWESLRSKSYDVLFYNNPDDEGPRNWGKSDFLRANKISLYTNRAISKRAEKVSEIEFFLIDRKSKDRIDDHDFLSLLNKPNKFMTGLQFWGLYQKYRDLVGSAYIWKVPSSEIFDKTKISELILLRPDCVSIEYTDGVISGFKHSMPGGRSFVLPPEQIIYLYTPDPERPTEGVSLLQAGVRAIDTEVQLAQYHANVIRNGGNVGNVIKFKAQNITAKQIAELKQQYADQYAEARNGGKPLFLGGDADIIKLGMSPTELSYLESKKLILDDIVIMTGVPRAALAVSSGETFANAEASINIFLRETVKPLMTDLATILDWQLIPEQYDLHFTDPTPENVELKLKRVETGLKNGYMTINEARELDGLEPMPDADTLLVPSGMRPLEQALKEPEQQPNPNDQKPPKEEKGLKDHPLKDDFIRDRYGKVMVKRMDRNEQKVLDAMQTYFSGQRRRIVEYVEGTRKRKDVLDSAFNHELEINIAKGTLLPLIKEILKRAGTDAKEMGGSSFPFILSQRIEAFLDLRANVFAHQITETTFEKLKSEFATSLEAGESRPQLIARIRSTYEGYDESRARTIARTEVHAATQTGTMEGYRQASLKTKIWVAVGDAATRDTHRAVDGEEVPIDMLFSNGLRYPGDPDGAPEEVINCRCSI